MKLPDLIQGKLIRRYKRFLADVELDGGRVVTAFVPNTGSLMSCLEPGRPAFVRYEGKPGRKYDYTLTLLKPERSLVCVDTGIPNKVVYDFAASQKIKELAGFEEYLREVPYGTNSRIDLLCRIKRNDMLARLWVEVKSTTLKRGKVAQFPDAVTGRGLKHLKEMTKMVRLGDRAVQLYFVQRGDCESFAPADDIDPEYAKGLRQAVREGVEVLALAARVTQRSITVKGTLPVEL